MFAENVFPLDGTVEIRFEVEWNVDALHKENSKDVRKCNGEREKHKSKIFFRERIFICYITSLFSYNFGWQYVTAYLFIVFKINGVAPFTNLLTLIN